MGDEDFYIDLLFYHLRLRAFVVIELKKGKFKPEYAGKLNFYCTVVNDRLKQPTDQPTIGPDPLSGAQPPAGRVQLCRNRQTHRHFHLRTHPRSAQGHEVRLTAEEIEAELSEVAKQTEAKRTKGKRGGKVREAVARYGAAGIRIVDQPFDATDGADTPFGRRWGGDVAKLTPAHLAAIKAPARPLLWTCRTNMCCLCKRIRTHPCLCRGRGR